MHTNRYYIFNYHLTTSPISYSHIYEENLASDVSVPHCNFPASKTTIWVTFSMYQFLKDKG